MNKWVRWLFDIRLRYQVQETPLFVHLETLVLAKQVESV